MAGYTIKSLVPFNPVDKRTSATVVTPEGQELVVAKGAPQVSVLHFACIFNCHKRLSMEYLCLNEPPGFCHTVDMTATILGAIPYQSKQTSPDGLAAATPS